MLLPANGELEARASFAVFVFMVLRDDGVVADRGGRLQATLARTTGVTAKLSALMANDSCAIL